MDTQIHHAVAIAVCRQRTEVTVCLNSDIQRIKQHLAARSCHHLTVKAQKFKPRDLNEAADPAVARSGTDGTGHDRALIRPHNHLTAIAADIESVRRNRCRRRHVQRPRIRQLVLSQRLPTLKLSTQPHSTTARRTRCINRRRRQSQLSTRQVDRATLPRLTQRQHRTLNIQRLAAKHRHRTAHHARGIHT